MACTKILNHNGAIIMRIKSFLLSLLLSATPCFAQSTSSSHVWERAAYGDVPGITHVLLNGFETITTTSRTMWPEQSVYTPLAAAMSSPYCASSDNTNDNVGGTGCRTMRVSGVNTSYTAFSETLTMTGTTSVNLTTANILSINKMQCLTAGTTFNNTGTIRCGTGTNTAGTPAVVHGRMSIGYGISQSFIYTVPAGHTLVCKDFVFASYGVTAAQSIQFYMDRYVDPVAGKVLIHENIGQLNQAGTSAYVSPIYMTFTEKTILLGQALSAASTGPVQMSANCLLINNSWENSPQTLF